MTYPPPYACTTHPLGGADDPTQPGGLSATVRTQLAIPPDWRFAAPVTPQARPSTDAVYTHLLTFFAIPRTVLPLTAPALRRLIGLVLDGYDVRAYPRLGASDHDLEDPAWWNLWLHDHRMTLAEYLAHEAEGVPVSAFPGGAPVLHLAASSVEAQEAAAAAAAEAPTSEASEGIAAPASGATGLEVAW